MDPLHDLTLGDVLREHHRSRPQRTAVVCGEFRATFPELDRRTNQLAAGRVTQCSGWGRTATG
jgi:non-ribosomal peptide synthetase component E (peptide arylation enzyme)